MQSCAANHLTANPCERRTATQCLGQLMIGRQTPMQKWVGGQSLLDPEGGAPEPLVRQMLAPDQNPHAIQNLSLVGEIENHPWDLRVHNRHTASYSVHIFACRKT